MRCLVTHDEEDVIVVVVFKTRKPKTFPELRPSLSADGLITLGRARGPISLKINEPIIIRLKFY